MPWGSKASAGDEWAARLRANDPDFRSLTVMPFRSFEDDDVLKVASALARNTSLVELSASGRSLSAVALEALAKMLQQNSTLSILRVGDDALGDSGLATLSLGLAGNKSLEVLDLSFKGLGDCGDNGRAGLETICGSGGAVGVTELLLSRNDLLGDIAAMVIAEGRLDGGLPCLTKLDLGQTGLGPAGCEALGLALSGITTLVLSSNSIGERGATALGEFLCSLEWRSLESLELNNCGLGDGGVTGLMKGIQCANSESRLRHLFLNNNDITAEGACIVAAAIQNDVSLQTLGLRENPRIAEPGALSLAAALAAGSNTSLASLDIGQCEIGCIGAAALLGSPGIKTLELVGNSLGEGFDDILDNPALFRRAVQLEDLDLSGNEIKQNTAFRLFGRLTSPLELPALATLGFGGNSVLDKGEWEEKVTALRKARDVASKHLRVIWS